MNGKRASPSSGDASNSNKANKISLQDQIAKAKERAAQLAAERGGQNAGKPSSPKPSTPAQAPPPGAGDAKEAARRRLEEMKARINAATKAAGTSQADDKPSAPPNEEEMQEGQGGLGVALHPLLAGNKGKDSSAIGRSSIKNLGSKSKVRQDTPTAVQGDDAKTNPYIDESAPAPAPGTVRRNERRLIFPEQGRYAKQGAASRKIKQIEELKARIAASTRRAGLEEDPSEASFVVQEPPSFEWWDDGLLLGDADGGGKAYPDFDNDMNPDSKLDITGDDSVITLYIQHPILIEPPQAKNMPAPKPLYLTTTEQAKMRRQRRRAELQEKQAKQRLGLIEKDKPKVSRKNLMRVLGEEAVRDPTAVESRVNREIAERRADHEATNAERALSKEERTEKYTAKQQADAARGIHISAYRIDSLAYGQHRFKLDMEAKRQGLTGLLLYNPAFNLVIVEGGEHSLQPYDKLLRTRISWTDIAPPTSAQRDSTRDLDKLIADAAWLQPLDAAGTLKDNGANRCVRVWTGEVRQRAFKGWRQRVTHSENEAKELLARAKMENVWQLAKNCGPSA